MKLIPEYHPVQRLSLCYKQSFYNLNFNYARTLFEIIEAAQRYVEVEILVSNVDFMYFNIEAGRASFDTRKILFNFDTPNQYTLSDFTPFFVEEAGGALTGFMYQNSLLERADHLKRFSHSQIARLEYTAQDMGMDFSYADLLVNDDLALVSDRLLKGTSPEEKLSFFTEHFPQQAFHLIPSHSGDAIEGLDMLLWPVAPKVWIASDYPVGTPQAAALEPALEFLKEHGHAIHHVPTLEPIQQGEKQVIPNYTSGVILNHAALVPSYQRKEDAVVTGILRDCHYTVHPIDCSNIILANCGLHRISRTYPRAG